MDKYNKNKLIILTINQHSHQADISYYPVYHNRLIGIKTFEVKTELDENWQHKVP